jgi:hypothetical protein
VGFGRNRLDPARLAAFKGYTLGPLAFSPDGKKLAVGGGEGSVGIIDVAEALKEGITAAANNGEDRPPRREPVVVALEGMKSTAPADWRAIAMPGQAELGNYDFVLRKVEGDDYDARLGIAHDPTAGFSAADSTGRMLRSFVPPPGKRIEDLATVTRRRVGNLDATYVDIRGTYRYAAMQQDKPSGQELRPDWRLIGVVIPAPKGGYVIRLHGPARTVERYQQGFEEWLKGFN